MKLLPEEGSYIPKTGESDIFRFNYVKEYDYYVLKWGLNQTAVLKEGETMDIKNKVTGSGYPTALMVDRGKLYVLE